MHHKLTSAAIAVAAAVGSLTAILPGTAAAEAVYHVSGKGLGVRATMRRRLAPTRPAPSLRAGRS